MIGLPDIHGGEAWRGFFAEQGFFTDGGEPGEDPRFGLGMPLIHKILDWLKETTWV